MLAKEYMAKYYNKGVADHEPKLKVGDKVNVNGKNIKTLRLTNKLYHKMCGLFKVKRLGGPYTYELEIPSFVGRPHPVYHISLL